MAKIITISKEIEIDAGHRVPKHNGKCSSPHGHRYKVKAYCTGSIIEEPGAPDEGMLVDFGDLKTILMEEVDAVLDHGFIVYEGDDDMLVVFTTVDNRPIFGWKVIIFPYIPTAENIARWIYERVEPLVAHRFRGNLSLSAIEVWETPTSMAVYEGLDSDAAT